jgi:hypothetical protein
LQNLQFIGLVGVALNLYVKDFPQKKTEPGSVYFPASPYPAGVAAEALVEEIL